MLNGDRFTDKETEIFVANTPAKQRHTGDPDYVGQVEKTPKHACTTERFGSLTPLMSCFHTQTPGTDCPLHWGALTWRILGTPLELTAFGAVEMNIRYLFGETTVQWLITANWEAQNSGVFAGLSI